MCVQKVCADNLESGCKLPRMEVGGGTKEDGQARDHLGFECHRIAESNHFP